MNIKKVFDEIEIRALEIGLLVILLSLATMAVCGAVLALHAVTEVLL